MVFIVTMVTIISILASRWRFSASNNGDLTCDNHTELPDEPIMSVWSVDGTYRPLSTWMTRSLETFPFWRLTGCKSYSQHHKQCAIYSLSLSGGRVSPHREFQGDLNEISCSWFTMDNLTLPYQTPIHHNCCVLWSFKPSKRPSQNINWGWRIWMKFVLPCSLILPNNPNIGEYRACAGWESVVKISL